MRKRAMRVNDTLLDELRQANPVSSDDLPSSRDPQPAWILEEIVKSSAPAPAPPSQDPVDHIGSARRRRRKIGALAAAVIVAAATTVGVFAIDLGTAPDANAEVHRAASASAASAAGSMRWETRVIIGLAEPEPPLEFSIAGTVSGGNSEITWRSHSDMSSVGMDDIGPLTVVAVDGEAYISTAEGTWEGPRPVSEFPVLSAITADALIGDLGQQTGFTRVGDEVINGENWTRYRSHAAPNNAIRSIMVLTLGFSQIPVDAGQSSKSEDPYLNVWIDGDDLIRRVSFGPETITAGSFTAITDFEGFGEPVEIDKPIAQTPAPSPPDPHRLRVRRRSGRPNLVQPGETAKGESQPTASAPQPYPPKSSDPGNGPAAGPAPPHPRTTEAPLSAPGPPASAGSRITYSAQSSITGCRRSRKSVRL